MKVRRKEFSATVVCKERIRKMRTFTSFCPRLTNIYNIHNII